MLIYTLVGLVGVFIYLFIFWRKLKEDYVSNQIFTTGILSILFGLLAYFISARFLPMWWFWLTLIGFTGGLSLGIIKYHMRGYETAEAAGVAILPFYFLIFITDSIINQSIYSFLYAMTVVMAGVIYLILNSKYKEFSWYASGRVGFAGLTAIGVFFLMRGIIAFIFPDMISFVGKIDALISGMVAFVVFLSVFNLAREK
jgi:hypothetical protein